MTIQPLEDGPPPRQRSKDEVAAELVRWHFETSPEITEIWRVYAEDEDRDDEPIKLLEVDPESAETDHVDAFYIAPNETMEYPLVVALVTPHELDKIRVGAMELPAGFNLDRATRFRRDPAPEGASSA
jgi:hypothetical protein